MSARIFVRFQSAGIHHWPGATGERAYLATPHRHQFHVEVAVPVTHDDREVEFHDLLEFCRSAFPTGDLGAMSCEMLARQLGDAVMQRYLRPVTVTVSEDGECGSVVEMAPPQHLICREIGIDTMHRVPDHGSKCRNLHGHRYKVEAICSGPLAAEGEQRGMVLDFGFLKAAMMEVIDAACDHGTVLWVDDPLLPTIAGDEMAAEARAGLTDGFWAGEGQCGKLYVIGTTPTAENLARHWHQRLAPEVVVRSGGLATLAQVRVWETPNCWAAYPAEGGAA